MAIVPHSGTTASDLAKQEVNKGNIPIVCPECNAVGGMSHQNFVNALSENNTLSIGMCDNCKENFIPVDTEATALDPSRVDWEL